MSATAPAARSQLRSLTQAGSVARNAVFSLSFFVCWLDSARNAVFSLSFFDFFESELPRTCVFIEFFDILEFKAKIKSQRQLQQHGATFVTYVRP